MIGMPKEFKGIDPDTGFIALGACVIMQALEDVRLWIESPDFGTGGTRSVDKGKAVIRFKCRTSERSVRAAQAAKWLNSPQCRELCDLLAACGCRVPMKRFFRELEALKQKGAAHHG